MTAADAISLSEADNVATVLRAVDRGEQLTVACGGAHITLTASDRIPLCHKISLAELQAGATVFKYGQPIGLATAPIGAGAHVHVHNMRSGRVTR